MLTRKRLDQDVNFFKAKPEACSVLRIDFGQSRVRYISPSTDTTSWLSLGDDSLDNIRL